MMLCIKRFYWHDLNQIADYLTTNNGI